MKRSVMIKEKKTLLILRVIFGVLLLAGIIIPLVLWFSPEKDIDLIDCDDDGYGYFVATFSEEVVEADIDFVFYDANEMIVERKTVHFGDKEDEPKTVLRARIPSVSSSVVAYEATRFSVSYESAYGIWIYVFILADVILVACVVQSLTMSCKLYDYNGRSILVYAGWFRRYIKVNDIKVAERSTAFTYGAVNLSCMLDDGAQALATITRMNKIDLRVNNQVLPVQRRQSLKFK